MANEAEIIAVAAGDHQSELRVFRHTGAPEQASPTILCLPAMGVAAKKYDALALALSQQGFNVAIAEMRGIGSSSVRASRAQDFGYQEIVCNDIPAAKAQLDALFPGEDVYFLGHSLGGQMASLYLGQNPEASAGLILCASCTVYFNNWPFPANLGLLLFTQFGGLLATVMGYFPGRRLGFGGREAKSVMQDWAYNARSGRYRSRQADLDLEGNLNNIQCPVLTINFSDDTFAPLTGTNHLVDKFSSAASANRRKIGLTAEHIGATRADHFAWIKQPQEVAINVANWVQTLNR